MKIPKMYGNLDLNKICVFFHHKHGNFLKWPITVLFPQKGVYRNVKVTEKFEGNRELDEIDSNIGLRQVYLLSPVLFNKFIDDILSRLEKANTHPPVIRKRQVVGLLFADNLAVEATRIG
jgi:hypothetical protein